MRAWLARTKRVVVVRRGEPPKELLRVYIVIRIRIDPLIAKCSRLQGRVAMHDESRGVPGEISQIERLRRHCLPARRVTFYVRVFAAGKGCRILWEEELVNEYDPAGPRRRTESAWLRYAIPIAAGALLVGVGAKVFHGREGDMEIKIPSRGREESKVTLGENERASQSPAQPSASGSKVVALFPFGTFAEPPPQFVWTRDPKATAYRLELMEESGNVFFSTETPETTFAFPADDLGWLRIGSWRVIPLTAGSAGSPSEAMRVRIDNSLGQ